MAILDFLATDLVTGIIIGFYLTIAPTVAVGAYRKARENPDSDAWATVTLSVLVGICWPVFIVVWAFATAIGRLKR